MEYEKNIESVNIETYLGMDYAMADFYVDSNRNKGNYLKLYRLSQCKLVIEQRELSRMVKWSNSYNKQGVKLARIHEKIVN